MSSLNPYATSYVPLSKRNVNKNGEALIITGNDSKGVHCEPPEHSRENKQSGKASLNYNALCMGKFTLYELSTEKSHLPHGSSTKKRDEITHNQMLDVEFDMDLEYLQMTFLGISYESLADVYLVNNGDLEAAIDMLNQLECYTAVSSDSLPDTLDIGDNTEAEPSAENGSMKLKEMEGDASGSSSGTTELGVLT